MMMRRVMRMLMMLISHWCSPDGGLWAFCSSSSDRVSVDLKLLWNTLSLEGDGWVDVS